MNQNREIAILLCSMFVSNWASAQDPTGVPGTVATDDAIHSELRELREVLTQAVLKGDTEGQLGCVHDNVVTTWPNNQVVRGHEGLRGFLNEMSVDNQKVFQGYTVPPTADELTILHGGDTGIVFGKSIPHYKYLGMEFDLENRWTATVIKEAGKWKIAAYHVSANVVDNPLLSSAKSSVYWTAGISLLIGLALGRFSGSILKTKRMLDA